jgi:hypothetical protein
MCVGSISSGHPKHLSTLPRSGTKEGEPLSIVGKRRVNGDGLAAGDSLHGSSRAVEHEQGI